MFLKTEHVVTVFFRAQHKQKDDGLWSPDTNPSLSRTRQNSEYYSLSAWDGKINNDKRRIIQKKISHGLTNSLSLSFRFLFLFFFLTFFFFYSVPLVQFSNDKINISLSLFLIEMNIEQNTIVLYI